MMRKPWLFIVVHWTFGGLTYEPVEGGRSIVEPARFIARPGDTVTVRTSP